MSQIITAEIKDVVLRLLLEKVEEQKDRRIGMEPSDWQDLISFNALEAVLQQFERYGFIEVINTNKRNLLIYVNVDADDFINRGGFYGQEILFQKSVEDLLTEIEVVKPALGDRAEQFSTIASNLLAFYTLLKSGGV